MGFGLTDIFGGDIVAGVTKLIQTFVTTPEQKIALTEMSLQMQQHAADLEAERQQAVLDLQKQTIASVNTTMQAEARSDHWLQWAWRPLFGLTGAAVLAMNYVVIPVFGGHWGIKPVEMPGEAWNTILAVAGVSAATRGWEKISKASK